MCELAVFLKALLYVILKAHAIFISLTVLLATLSVAQAKKVTINFIDVQVAFVKVIIVVVVETLNSSLILRCYRFTKLRLPHISNFFVVELQIFCRVKIC